MFEWLGQRLGKREQKTGQPLFGWFRQRLGKREQKTGQPLFGWFRQRLGKREQKTGQPLFGWFRQRLGKREQKTGQQQAGGSGDLVTADSALRQASADSLRSLFKTAITDAEEIVASIKMRAQAEAEAEAARIIAQAKLEIQDIKGKAEIAVQKETEEMLSAANRKAEITEMEAKQKALQYLISASEALISTSQAAVPPIGTSAPVETELTPDTASKEEKIEEPVRLEEEVVEKVEEPVRLEEEVVEEKIEEPVRLEEEVVEKKIEEPVRLEEEVVEEKVEEPVRLEEKVVEKKVEESVRLEEKVVEEKVKEVLEDLPGQRLPAEREGGSALLELDSRALHTGEVELIIAAPVELKLVSRLYNYLQTVPDLRILYTRGSWDRGTTITVVLEKSMPLIGVISETPGVEVTPELLEEGELATGKSGLLMRGGERKIKSIKLVLREA